MPQLHGYSVTITSHGRDVEHYDVKLEDPDTVSCYIVSESGMEFAVQYADLQSRRTMKVDVLIDGRMLASKSAEPGKTLSIWGSRTSRTTRSTFKFSEITLVDDDDADGLVTPPNIGSIEVKLYRARIEKCRISSRSHYRRSDAPQTGPVSEKSKKGGWHQVSLGRDRRSEWQPSPTKTIRLDPIDAPYATFRFNYRPRAMLQAENIIPPLGMLTKLNVEALQVPVRKRSPSPHIARNSNQTLTAEAGPSTHHVEPNDIIEISSDEEDLPSPKAECGSPIHLGLAAGEIIDLTID